jgi:hypothetical protein
MRIHARLSVTTALLLSASVLVTAPQAHASTGVVGPLSVVGNQVVDGSGNVLILRGIHRNGTEASPPNFPSADELGWIGKAHAASWMANLVRVPVGSAQWTGACPSLANTPAAYQASVDAEINAITSQGLVALLDLHTSTAACTAIDRHAMPDYDVTRQFWASAAAHFASNPLVAFELYNEPHWVSQDIWLNGTSSATVQDCAPVDTTQTNAQQAVLLAKRQLCLQNKPKYRAIGMQELYNLTTTTAPQHLVVVDGNDYAGSPPATPLVASHGELAYALHPYTCPLPGDPCDSTAKAHANTGGLEKWVSTSQRTPVIATEIGWPVYPTNDGQNYTEGTAYYSETLAFLQRQSPQWGFAAFAFDGNTSGGFDMITSTTTYEPNSTAQPVYDLLRAS